MWTRRELLKLSATATLFACGGDRPPPSERITIGLIGCGQYMRSFCGNVFAQPDAQVIAVCDVEKTRREHLRDTANNFYEEKSCTAHADFREVLAREDVDAVVISTPEHWHAIMAISAAERKKDIYCEKPISLTISEGRAIVDAVRAHDRVFQTGTHLRSDHMWSFGIGTVHRGRIGRVTAVEVGVAEPSVPVDLPEQSAPADVDWQMWLGPAPLRGYHEGELRLSTEGLATSPSSLAQEYTHDESAPPARRLHVRNWLDAIKARSTPRAAVELAHRSASVGHLANITYRLGRRLSWDSVAERFTDDEANALRVRARRSPWT